MLALLLGVGLAAEAESRPALWLTTQAAGPTARELRAAISRGDAVRATGAAKALATQREAALAGRPLELAHALVEIAEPLLDLQEPSAALVAQTLLERALALQAAPGADARAQVETLELLSRLHFDAGHWEDAEACDRRLVSLARSTGESGRADLGYALQKLAVSLFWQGRIREAEPHAREAVSVLESAGSEARLDLAYALNYLSENLRAQGWHAEAERLAADSLRTAEGATDLENADRVFFLVNVSGVYRDVHRYAEAQWLARRATDLADRATDVEAGERFSAYLNLAELYRFQGEPVRAEPFYRKALDVGRRSFRAGHPRLGTGLSQWAVNLTALGRHEEASAAYREALAVKSRGWGPRSLEVAYTLHDLGDLLALQGKLAEAEEQHRTALGIREERLGLRHPEVGVSCLSIAELLLRKGAPLPEVQAQLDRAIALLDATAAEPRAAARAHALLARLERDGGHQDSARTELARALAIVERLRPEAGGGEATRARYGAGYAAEFQRMASWLAEDGDSLGALSYAERGRARVFLDQLATAGGDLRRGISPEERAPLERREAALRADLSETSARLQRARARAGTSPGPDAVAALEVRQWALEREYEQLYEDVKNASRDWRGQSPASPPLTDLRGIGDALPAASLLLYFVIGPERSWLFVIRSGATSPELWPLEVRGDAASELGTAPGPVTSDVLAVVRDLGPGLAGRPSATSARGARVVDEGPTPVTRVLNALWKALIPGRLWDAIRGASQVVVVPDGVLNRLPFDALVVAPGASERATRYWLDEGPPVRYAASVAALLALARPRPGTTLPTRDVVSVSDPVYTLARAPGKSGAPTRRPGRPSATAVRGGWALPRLPGTAREAEAVRSAFACRGKAPLMLQRHLAREGAVRSALPTGRYLHLATHGLVDENGGALFAALALTPPPTLQKPEDDGFLQLLEIDDLRLGADLAVLSACDSRAGPLAPGEGVFALSRAFLTAGARRVVASLWPVDDAATAHLVSALFRGVAEAECSGRQPDVARILHQAKLATRQGADWAAPSYWAAFVLEGAP